MSTNNKQSKNYVDMYRKLPRNSLTRRRIERMLDNDVQSSRQHNMNVYPVPNCIPDEVNFF